MFDFMDNFDLNSYLSQEILKSLKTMHSSTRIPGKYINYDDMDDFESVHHLSFKEIKQRNRIELIDSFDCDRMVKYARDIFRSYSDLKLPFSFIFEEFVIRIPNRHQPGTSWWVHIRNRDPRENNLAVIDIYSFEPGHGLGKPDYTTIFVDPEILDIEVISKPYLFDGTDNSRIPETMEFLQHLYIPFFINHNSWSMSSIESQLQMVEKMRKEYKQDIFKYAAEHIGDLLFNANSIALFCIAVNYEIQCQLATRPTIKVTPREGLKRSSNIGSREQKPDTKTTDNRKVLTIDEMVIKFSDRKSYETFQRRVRRPCEYQYSVTGHFRHYKKTGKTIYIESYNKNKDKPFKGKTIIM